ncbi:hypothetical protein H6G54_05270 [Anabaena cylindrica FACHB-243]|uniref:Uncharacterized protein n=1 Tax=Anabaena cylindrica (strain ATCC 27899 / PCC 7122) TaxID=272123 RepID=K9ZQL5_ANACC|nr:MULTISPECIES: hypothetical protein [Anabaena]AFZ60832.1 hypothetical protein Anacy_5520 [Anabaena cylindrica PCC 7122]MBD2417130.1 hypothetical protein [Anabaena cylindrica FACHB-243]MBY5280826.1 hypothetical protein [Anabaena sp. CCAP 1446/1C]MBY5307102.1 hypothetical protein [Anabaena sp. CCAP 1446/1C]MCM2406831.1 hypothetical protein [Anabaena sp. CCAP 1446/1C]
MNLQQLADSYENKSAIYLDHAISLEELLQVEKDAEARILLREAIGYLQGASSHAYGEHLIKQGQANIERAFNL